MPAVAASHRADVEMGAPRHFIFSESWVENSGSLRIMLLAIRSLRII